MQPPSRHPLPTPPPPGLWSARSASWVAGAAPCPLRSRRRRQRLPRRRGGAPAASAACRIMPTPSMTHSCGGVSGGEMNVTRMCMPAPLPACAAGGHLTTGVPHSHPPPLPHPPSRTAIKRGERNGGGESEDEELWGATGRRTRRRRVGCEGGGGALCWLLRWQVACVRMHQPHAGWPLTRTPLPPLTPLTLPHRAPPPPLTQQQPPGRACGAGARAPPSSSACTLCLTPLCACCCC